jgi:peptidoglycan/LPS O-acetylase OafA/YrhL
VVYTGVVGAAMSFVAFLLVTDSHNLLWIFGVIIVSITLLCSIAGACAIHAKKNNLAKVHIA